MLSEHLFERAFVEEELESVQTQRLLRQAGKYYVFPPAITRAGDEDEDPNWARGWAAGAWYLRPAAVASVRREIEDAKKRRREAVESWSKIIGGIITALVALGSVIVSFVLAWRR